MIHRPSSHSRAIGSLPAGQAELSIATSAALSCAPAEATPVHPSCGAQACVVDGTALARGAGPGDPRQHTKYPYVTGTSVIGLKYRDGVMLVADTLG